MEKMLRNCTGDCLHKGVVICGDFCKNITENYRMEKGIFTHEEGDLELVGMCVSGNEGLLKTCRALQSVLTAPEKNCHILESPSVLFREWNLGNALSKASFQNANSNQSFC